MTNDVNSNRNIINESAAVRNNEKKARKEGLTKGVWTTAIISFILLLAVGIGSYSIYKNEQNRQLAVIESQKQSFTGMLTSRDSVINEWMMTFDQIEKDLNMVKEKEHIITMSSSNVELSKEKTTDTERHRVHQYSA